MEFFRQAKESIITIEGDMSNMLNISGPSNLNNFVFLVFFFFFSSSRRHGLAGSSKERFAHCGQNKSYHRNLTSPPPFLLSIATTITTAPPPAAAASPLGRGFQGVCLLLFFPVSAAAFGIIMVALIMMQRQARYMGGRTGGHRLCVQRILVQYFRNIEKWGRSWVSTVSAFCIRV